jgi:hypothetical protein
MTTFTYDDSHLDGTFMSVFTLTDKTTVLQSTTMWNLNDITAAKDNNTLTLTPARIADTAAELVAVWGNSAYNDWYQGDIDNHLSTTLGNRCMEGSIFRLITNGQLKGKP